VLAEQGGAGLPTPLVAGAETMELDEPGREWQLRAVFDLLGILGLGRSAAASALAESRVRGALADVERTLWSGRFAVDRARVRVVAAHQRVAVLAELEREATAEHRRIDILESHGWLPAGQIATARALTERLRNLLTQTRAMVAEERLELTSAAGLPTAAPQLVQVANAPLTFADPNPAPDLQPEPRTLLTRHPRLRALVLDYAIAEARLQAAAAQAWPYVGIGPRLTVQPDSLLGGILEISLPWPGTVSAAVHTALAEREAARERVEDGLLQQQTRVVEHRQRWLAAWQAAQVHGPQTEQRSRAAWRAARARFAVDATALMAWSDTFERRIESCTAAVDAAANALLAQLDYQEARGPLELP
jgi:outer membrane protein TolC